MNARIPKVLMDPEKLGNRNATWDTKPKGPNSSGPFPHAGPEVRKIPTANGILPNENAIPRYSILLQLLSNA
jgi:hypothetical protein